MFLHLTEPTETQTRAERSDQLFRLRPIEVQALIEAAHEFRVWDQSQHLGHPDRRTDTAALPRYLLDLFGDADNQFIQQNRDLFFPGTDPDSSGNPVSVPRTGRLRCPHWIYIYLIECTRCFQIFKRVLYEYRVDEKLLGTPLPAAQHWLRMFEDLFCSAPPVFGINHVISMVRPDPDAVRLNGYDRMLGTRLPFPSENGEPYKFHEAASANREFMPTLYKFLEELWLLLANNANSSGANPGDVAATATHAEKLHNMLRQRRQHGNLSREECYFGAMFSFMHLSLWDDTSIIVSARSEGASPEERLKRLGERVGISPHDKSFYFFKLAEPLSDLMISIESGIYNNPAAIEALYDPSSPLEPRMRLIIEHLSVATGQNLKARTQNVVVRGEPALLAVNASAG
jgi:hypothetical protein